MDHPPPRPPAALLVDLDGTLVDTEAIHWQSAVDVLADLGIRLTAALEPDAGASDEAFWAAVGRHHALPLGVAQLIARRSDRLTALLADRELPAFSGAAELLALCRARNLPTMLVSSSPHRQIDAILGACGLLPSLPHRVSATDDVPRPKPAPDGYLLAARRLRAVPASCIAIEDSATGVAAARAAGMFVVAVVHGGRAGAALDAAHHRLPSLSHVSGWLAQLLA